MAGLSPWERAGLLALATLGWGSAADVRGVAGREVDLEVLVTKVPLLWSDDEGGYGIHQLWEEAVERLFPPHQVDELRERALALLWARGETLRVGSLALRWSAVDWLRRACVALVRESFGALPVDTASRWLAGAPDGARGRARARPSRPGPSPRGPPRRCRPRPGHRRPRRPLRHARRCRRQRRDARARRRRRPLPRRPAPPVPAGRAGAGVAGRRSRADPPLPGRSGEGGAGRAGRRRGGRAGGSCLDALHATCRSRRPSWSTRLHAAMLVLAGRADEAVVVGERLASLTQRLTSAASRRCSAGRPVTPRAMPGRADPTGRRRGDQRARPPVPGRVRLGGGRLVRRPRLQSSRPNPSSTRSWPPSPMPATAPSPPWPRPTGRSSPTTTGPRSETIAAHLGSLPADRPARRDPPPPFARDRVRVRPDRSASGGDGVALGPSHERSLDVARQLLDGSRRPPVGRTRSCRPARSCSPPCPCRGRSSWLPGPRRLRCRDGRRLIAGAGRLVTDAVHDELAWLAGQGDRRAAPRCRRAPRLPARPGTGAAAHRGARPAAAAGG